MAGFRSESASDTVTSSCPCPPNSDSRDFFQKPLQVVSRPDYFEKAVVPHLRTHGKEAMDPVDSAAKAIVKELFPGKTAVFDYGN